jgi:peptide/nickel transport system substrate-binding protein
MDPHSNAKAFAYNSNNADDNYTATTTWRNAWAVPEDMNKEVLAALAEPDQAKRSELYIDLQKKVQAESPIIIMFQAELQIAMAKNVDGYVNGSNSDFVYYRLVKKN